MLRPTDHYLPVDKPDPTGVGFTDADADNVTVADQQKRDTRWLVRNWERARLDAERLPQGCILMVDEVHKIPEWSETVKGLWDADRARRCPLHVVILGSAPLLMQSGLSERLTGRFEPIRVPHWSFAEMAAAFDFDLPAYLYFGGYPGAASLARDEERWRNYVLGGIVEPTVERDLLALTRVDKPVLLKRLVELAAAHSGQILSYTKMLGQLWDAGNTTTLARYLDLLGSAGLIAGLQKYAGSAVSRRGSSPKLFCPMRGVTPWPTVKQTRDISKSVTARTKDLNSCARPWPQGCSRRGPKGGSYLYTVTSPSLSAPGISPG